MKIQIKHSLKTDVGAAFKLCTELKSQESVYAKLGGTDLRIKRGGRAPNVKLEISRKMPANPPAAIRRFVPATNEVAHTENWAAGRRRLCRGHRRRYQGRAGEDRRHQELQPEKGGCSVAWALTSRAAFRCSAVVIANFAGEELQKNLEDEFKVLKALV